MFGKCGEGTRGRPASHPCPLVLQLEAGQAQLTEQKLDAGGPLAVVIMRHLQARGRRKAVDGRKLVVNCRGAELKARAGEVRPLYRISFIG